MITKSDVSRVIKDFVMLARKNHQEFLEYRRKGKWFEGFSEFHRGRSLAYLLCAHHVKLCLMCDAENDLTIQNLIHEREERHTPETADLYTAAQMEKQCK